MKNTLLISAVALLLLAACQNDKTIRRLKPIKGLFFFDAAGMDSTVKPGDNFFLYANGKWMKNTQIPKTEIGWGSIYTLFNNNQKKIKTLLENAAKGGG